MEAYSSQKPPFSKSERLPPVTYPAAFGVWILEFLWCLEFGAWDFALPPPLATSAISRHLPLAVSRGGGGERRIRALNGGQWRVKKSPQTSHSNVGLLQKN